MNPPRPASRFVTRRAVLAAVVAGCAVAGIATRSGESNRLVPHIRRLLARSVRATREDYETAHALVFGNLGSTHVVRRMSHTEIAKRIQNHIAADFRAGRIANVGGWQISNTELRALGLMRTLRTG